MSGFKGSVDGTFDARKGRISVPSLLRNELSRFETDDLLVKASRHAACIEVWPETTYMKQVKERVAGLNSLTAEYRLAMRKLMAPVHPARPDSEGRIVLPRSLFEHAGLDGEVSFLGLGDYFEIWSKAKLAEEDAKLAAEDPGGDV